MGAWWRRGAESPPRKRGESAEEDKRMHAVYAAGQILVIGSLSGEVGLPMRTAYALPPSSREARTTRASTRGLRPLRAREQLPNGHVRRSESRRRDRVAIAPPRRAAPCPAAATAPPSSRCTASSRPCVSSSRWCEPAHLSPPSLPRPPATGLGGSLLSPLAGGSPGMSQPICEGFLPCKTTNLASSWEGAD